MLTMNGRNYGNSFTAAKSTLCTLEFRVERVNDVAQIRRVNRRASPQSPGCDPGAIKTSFPREHLRAQHSMRTHSQGHVTSFAEVPLRLGCSCVLSWYIFRGQEVTRNPVHSVYRLHVWSPKQDA